MDHTYPLHTRTTANGVRVCVNPDPWVPGVAVNLWYGVGSVHERAGKTGFAHLFEHLMFSGSAQVSSGDYTSLIQSMGGSTNATTSFDRTNYFETVPRGGLDLALWLEAERLASLLESVDQTNLDTQREVVKEEKRLRYDNVPYGDAFARIMALVFPPGHGYAHMPIGSMRDVDAATLTDVHDFFHRHYAPDNLIITLSGAVHPDEGFDLVETYFSQIPAVGPRPGPRVDPLPPMTGVPRAQVEEDVPQEAVYCCWLIPPIADGTNDPIGAGLSVLAGSMSSRLHQALVRTELADSVDAFDLGLERGNSLVVATAACAESVSPEALEEALTEVWDEFCATGPTEEELSRLAKAEDREYLADLASIETRADHISAAWSLFGDVQEVNRHLDVIHALTSDQVLQACASWLKPENRAVLTYRRSS